MLLVLNNVHIIIQACVYIENCQTIDWKHNLCYLIYISCDGLGMIFFFARHTCGMKFVMSMQNYFRKHAPHDKLLVNIRAGFSKKIKTYYAD